MITSIQRCRLCGNTDLVRVLDLGYQALTGIFPAERSTEVTSGPMRLVKCHAGTAANCGLLQLEHDFDLSEMYGHNYGYRSGLNPSMVAHLRGKVERISARVALRAGDLVIDIGSNDSTTLRCYPEDLDLVGIDPTGVKFHTYYPKHVRLIPDFFTRERFAREFPGRKAKVITSFSMLYDLPDPLAFMRDVAASLDADGIWVTEQSYMPSMLTTNSYDTVCHEHIEYYALGPILWAAERAGLVAIDIEFNDVNGGSFSLTLAHRASTHARDQTAIDAVIAEEKRLGLDTLAPYHAFAARTAGARAAVTTFLDACARRGERVAGIGASTKGNVLLQYCDVRPDQMQVIGEVNAEKYGCFTPGTRIPILAEAEVLAQETDYLVVLPWHFRSFFVNNPRFRGRRLVFPLPQLEIVQL